MTSLSTHRRTFIKWLKPPPFLHNRRLGCPAAVGGTGMAPGDDVARRIGYTIHQRSWNLTYLSGSLEP